MDIVEIGILAKKSSKITANLKTDKKNEILNVTSDFLIKNTDKILKANEIDVKNLRNNDASSSFIDRLTLNENRIKEMADGLRQIAKLPDPIGQCEYMKTLPNGLQIAKKTVAMGVIGMIYEARPNVTSDAFALCLKAGSSVILRGGKEALNSNKAVVEIIKEAISSVGISADIIQLVESTDREVTLKMMKLNKYIDLLIPRGGAGLIKAVIENSTVPIIETGTGNCHIYVDEFADLNKALKVIINSKVQKTSACNSLEKVLIHKNISKEFLPMLYDELKNENVQIKADKNILNILKDKNLELANEEDWEIEYLDKIIALKLVNSLDEAIEHISTYSTKHSDGIITENYSNAMKFTNDIDSAVVYVNSSTRFSDGNEFGFGAEIGISTQKLHARGPMGLNEITSYKYIVFGEGQIRE